MEQIKIDDSTAKLLKDEITPFKRIEDTDGTKIVHAVQINESRKKSIELLTNKQLDNISVNDYISFDNKTAFKSSEAEFEEQFKPFASKENELLAARVRKLSETRGVHPAAALAEKQDNKSEQKQKRGFRHH